MTSYSWYLGEPATQQSAPWIYSSAIVSGGCLFILANIYYKRRYSGFAFLQKLLLSIFDLTTFYCVVALILWGLVLPIIRPISTPDFQLYLFGQDNLVIGLYTGLIFCLLIVSFRVVLQFLLRRLPNRVMIIAPPKVTLTGQVSNAAPKEGEDKKKIEDSLSLIRSEIAMLRAEISSLNLNRTWVSRSSIVEPTIQPPENNFGWAGGDGESITFPFNQIPATTAPPPSIQVQPRGTENLMKDAGLQVPESFSAPEYEPTTSDILLPDSAKDNPWASVLSRRQVKIRSVMTPPARSTPLETSVPVLLELQQPAPTVPEPQQPVQVEEKTEVVMAPAKKSRKTKTRNSRSRSAQKFPAPGPEIAVDPKMESGPQSAPQVKDASEISGP